MDFNFLFCSEKSRRRFKELCINKGLGETPSQRAWQLPEPQHIIQSWEFVRDGDGNKIVLGAGATAEVPLAAHQSVDRRHCTRAACILPPYYEFSFLIHPRACSTFYLLFVNKALI